MQRRRQVIASQDLTHAPSTRLALGKLERGFLGMKLRAFLATVPLAAVALALPAKAAPRYIVAVDPCTGAPPRGKESRKWRKEVFDFGMVVKFTAITRRADGDSSSSEITMYRRVDCDSFDAEVRSLEERHAQWAALGGWHPSILATLNQGA